MSSLAQALIQYASTSGRSISPVLEALRESRRHEATHPQQRETPSFDDDDDHTGSGSPIGPGQTGGFQSGGPLYVLPQRWKGTHVTSGLGWGTKTATDIMLKAGTPLGAPEAGRIKYYHPTGAQGGGSLLFDPQAPGPDYWIGHIRGSAPIGKRIKRGQRFTTVSPEHAAPHAHVDRRWG